MGTELEIYKESEAEIAQPEALDKARKILKALGGDWEFSQLMSHKHPESGFETFDLGYYHSENEDYSFYMEWNNDDVPLEQALISTAVD